MTPLAIDPQERPADSHVLARPRGRCREVRRLRRARFALAALAAVALAALLARMLLVAEPAIL